MDPAQPGRSPTPLAEALSQLLAPVGLAQSSGRDAAVGAVAAYLASRELRAEVVSLRWGTLVLRADAPTCQLLSYEQDLLLAAADRAAPGTVSDISLQVGTLGGPES